MAFHFDLDLIKQHPYATGGVVLVGGLIVFYLLSSKGSAPSNAGSSNNAAQFAASQQQAQLQASESLQQSHDNVTLQTAELAANADSAKTAAAVDLGKTGIAAQLAATLASINGTTLQQFNSEKAGFASASLQAQVMRDNIVAGVNENQSNNDLNLQLGTNQLADAMALATQRQKDFQTNVQYIAPLAGQKKNSALDANNQTALFQTILAGGNPGVAVSGNEITANAVSSGNNASVAKVGAIAGAVSNVASTIAKGFFA